MALTKYASLEQAEVVGIKSSPTKVKTASLDKFADFHDYRTEDGFLYVSIRAISSRVNKNHDGWPTAELAGGSDAWERISSMRQSAEGFTIEASRDHEYGFSTFMGKPNFVDHHNSDPKRARGVVVDSKFRVLDQKTASTDDYWSSKNIDPTHLPAAEVELLIEIDADSFPKYAEAVVNGEIDGWSMGCDVDYSKCSHCGHEASSPDEYCGHIVSKGGEFQVESGEHAGRVSKSYENCYGIKFFEISGVFDPADETAKTRELKAAIEKEAAGLVNPNPGTVPQPQEAYPLLDQSNPSQAVCPACSGAGCPSCGGTGFLQTGQGGDGFVTPQAVPYGQGQIGGLLPSNMNLSPMRTQPTAPNDPRWSHVKTAQPEEPQSVHTKAPEDVDTLREEKVCPLCGSDMDDIKCDVCGFEEPPEQMQNPDLTKAREVDTGEQTDADVELPPDPAGAEPTADSYLNATKTQSTASIKNEMRWTPQGITTKLAADKPKGDEPQETVTSDQSTPVTSAFRTAQEMISAAAKRNQENNMSDQTKVAADPADASGKPDKRVDVEGTGGVIDATNEEASKPEGPHSWENAGTTVDVEGKGGVLQDSNAEASKPSVGTEDVEKSVKTQDSGPTKTWDNSNEPGSAVTDKAVQAAKSGPKPIGGEDVQPQRREDVEQESGFSNPQDGTDQWTGTGGNGVTRQADPVTKKVYTGGMVSLAALKLAEAEIELGITSEDDKYNRLAELADVDEAEITAEHRALSKVKTASKMTRTASKGGAMRVPSFRRIASEEAPAPTPVDDSTLDSALFN
jgi:hypothetical protein